MSFILGFVFLVLGIFTLTGYNNNWDAINHLPRGQAYLHFFLTGKKDYSDLPEFFADWNKKNQWYFQDPKSLRIKTNLLDRDIPTRSLYQLTDYDFNYFLAKDGYGHPPASDILTSLFNRLFFAKLRLINDIDSYHLYGIFLSALLVGLVYKWASDVYDKFAGLIAALSLTLYPLFWSEAHFNTEKDIPEAVFLAFMLYFVWVGITRKSRVSILVSGFFLGLALGTKFNVVFAIPIIALWYIFYFATSLILDKEKISKLVKEFFWLFPSALLAAPIGVLIFVLSWPYLWADPLARVSSVIHFYKDIGITSFYDPRFLGPFKINTYPLQTLLYSTPLVILFFTLFGLFFSVLELRKDKTKGTFLFLLWFLTPVVRVSWPGANIYGGLRQIMEFIPGMAIVSGAGAYFLRKKLPLKFDKRLASVLLVGLFVPITIKLISIHPNENVYFNPLIGGLSGAKAKNYPYWGNSFGSAYRQGVVWLNENASQNAHVVFAYELIPNIPRLFFRPDMTLYNGYRSGYLKEGEYAITLTYQGTNQRSYYDNYLDEELNPVYEVKVDNVSILKIWLNDERHTKDDYKREEVLAPHKIEKSMNGLILDTGREVRLSRIEGIYKETGCDKIKYAIVQISGNKNNWQRLPGVLPDDWLITALGEQPKNGKFIHPFSGELTRYIGITMDPPSACLKNLENIKIYYFPEI